MTEESNSNAAASKPPDNSPRRVFIGHKERNGLTCFVLAYLLESHGVRTWLYERDNRGGVPYSYNQRRILFEQACGYILILSPEALGTPRIFGWGARHIKDELSDAKHVQQQKGDQFRLLLILHRLKDINSLRGTWISKIYGESILGDVARNIDISCWTMKHYDKWLNMVQSGGIDYAISEWRKVVTDLNGRDTFTETPELTELDARIRKAIENHQGDGCWRPAILLIALLIAVAVAVTLYFRNMGQRTDSVVYVDPAGKMFKGSFVEPEAQEVILQPANTVSPETALPPSAVAVHESLGVPDGTESSIELPMAALNINNPGENAVVMPTANLPLDESTDLPLSSTALLGPILYEAEAFLSKSTYIMQRDNASGAKTLKLFAGESIAIPVKIHMPGKYDVVIKYSRDSSDAPPDAIHILVDDEEKASIQAKKTGEFGDGWNAFAVSSNSIGYLQKGAYALRIVVGQVDQEGVEIDSILLQRAGAQDN